MLHYHGTGNAIIIFAEGDNVRKTYYNKATSTWVDDPPVVLAASTLGNPPEAFSHIAFRGTDAVVSFAVDNGFIYVAELKFTTDYGANWISQSIPGFYFWPPVPTRYSDVDFLGSNVMLIVNAVGSRIRYFSNPFFGVGVWSQSNISAANLCINPYVRFTSNSGQDVLVTWEDTTANQIFENHTADFGATWTGAGGLGTALSAAGATAHQFEALIDGTGIVVWQTQAPAPTPNTIEETHTSNGGAAFSPPVVISGTDAATIPQLAMKANFGCALGLEAAGAGVHAAETIDSGATWGIPTDR